MIGPPDPTGDLLAHIEITRDGDGAYVRAWSRFLRTHAFHHWRRRWLSFDQALVSHGKSRPGTVVYVNGERV
jgi:hypothetical protein